MLWFWLVETLLGRLAQNDFLTTHSLTHPHLSLFLRCRRSSLKLQFGISLERRKKSIDKADARSKLRKQKEVEKIRIQEAKAAAAAEKKAKKKRRQEAKEEEKKQKQKANEAAKAAGVAIQEEEAAEQQADANDDKTKRRRGRRKNN